MRYKNNTVNQPPPGFTVAPTQWPNMPIPWQHYETYRLSIRCGDCIAQQRLKLGVLWWHCRNLSMQQLDTISNTTNFLLIAAFPMNPEINFLP